MSWIASLVDDDNEGYDTLLDICCDLLAPLVQGLPDGALATVQGAYASHRRAPEFLVAACTGLRARHDEGERVHLAYLPGNVLDLIQRAERGDASAEPQAYAESTPESEAKWEADRDEAARLAREWDAKYNPPLDLEKLKREREGGEGA